MVGAGEVNTSETVVAANGQSDYVIVVPERATPVEAFAAAELARYIEAVAGVRLPVVREGEWGGGGPCLAVGNTRAYLACLTPPEDGRHDRFVIRRFRGGVLLNGNNRRGVLFAVYRLLETCAGISLALAENELVPRGSTVLLPENEVAEQAHLANREIVGHSSDVDTNLVRLDYLAKNLGNSIQFPLAHWQENREVLLRAVQERGLDVTIGGHIYEEFLPEERHFDEHPDWFPEIERERTRGTGQICYSAAGAEVFVAEAVRGLQECWAEEVKRFSLWFGDNALFCTCAGCPGRSFYDHYAGMVSAIGRAWAELGMPPVALDICIYNSDNEHKSDLTLLEPRVNERPDNINVFYSYWGRDYTQPLAESASPCDAQSYARLREWCALFRGAAGFPRVGEYYADSNQLTAMAPVIPERIRDDLLTYKNAGMGGMHVCIHLWWSPDPAYPMFWVMSFNLHAYLRFAWNHNLPVSEVLPPVLAQYFGDAAGETDAILTAIREAVLPLTRYNLAGPVCSLAGTTLWHVPWVPGGPRYTFDPEVDEFAAFRREVTADLQRAVETMEQAAPALDAFTLKAPQGTATTRNFATYYSYTRGNLNSKLLQARAQEAIATGDLAAAKEQLAQVFALEKELYRTGIRDIAEWAEAHRDSPRVRALGLDDLLEGDR